MRTGNKLLLVGLTALIMLLGLAGCEKNYMVLRQLEQPLNDGAVFAIGAIDDELPIDLEPDKRPSLEQIEKLRASLFNKMEERDLGFVIDNVTEDDPGADYIIDGAILNYKKGSGVVRAFIGFGLGNAKCELHLRLVNARTREVVFSGAFEAMVSSYLESGDKMFDRVATDFSKELEKQSEKLTRHRKQVPSTTGASQSR